MKKFKKGTFELEHNVQDLVAFEEPRKAQLMDIVNWATANQIGITFGTSEDNTYLCEYDVVANTVQLCKGYVVELKAKLKPLFPKVRIIVEWTGNKLY